MMKNKFAVLALTAATMLAPMVGMTHADPNLAQCRAEQVEDLKLMQKQTEMIGKLTKALDEQGQLVDEQTAMIQKQSKLINEQDGLLQQQTKLLEKVGR
ncbi:MAG: hypothetical protein Q7S68_01185 [Deltaproteobacteria bacterium]|nr:hypothetical protein [Deltaproteobacteria bacterium]